MCLSVDGISWEGEITEYSIPNLLTLRFLYLLPFHYLLVQFPLSCNGSGATEGRNYVSHPLQTPNTDQEN